MKFATAQERVLRRNLLIKAKEAQAQARAAFIKAKKAAVEEAARIKATAEEEAAAKVKAAEEEAAAKAKAAEEEAAAKAKAAEEEAAAKAKAAEEEASAKAKAAEEEAAEKAKAAEAEVKHPRFVRRVANSNRPNKVVVVKESSPVKKSGPIIISGVKRF